MPHALPAQRLLHPHRSVFHGCDAVSTVATAAEASRGSAAQQAHPSLLSGRETATGRAVVHGPSNQMPWAVRRATGALCVSDDDASDPAEEAARVAGHPWRGSNHFCSARPRLNAGADPAIRDVQGCTNVAGGGTPGATPEAFVFFSRAPVCVRARTGRRRARPRPANPQPGHPSALASCFALPPPSLESWRAACCTKDVRMPREATEWPKRPRLDSRTESRAMQQGCCGDGLDPIGESATRPSLACGPRLDPIGEKRKKWWARKDSNLRPRDSLRPAVSGGSGLSHRPRPRNSNRDVRARDARCLSLRALQPSGSLCTFRRCTSGSAQGCRQRWSLLRVP